MQMKVSFRMFQSQPRERKLCFDIHIHDDESGDPWYVYTLYEYAMYIFVHNS